MHEYTLLGECFETLTDEEMFGRGWMTENPQILVEDHADNLRRTLRELAAPVALARSQGKNWTANADALNVPVDAARTHLPEIP